MVAPSGCRTTRAGCAVDLTGTLKGYRAQIDNKNARDAIFGP